MRAVIITGGSITDYSLAARRLRPGDFVVCADGGYRHAVKLGLRPDLVVGDFDSAGDVPEDLPRVRYPVKKDLTDTEIALEHARSEGYDDFLILGGTGTRLDHTLANILLLKSCSERGETAVIADEHNEIVCARKLWETRGDAGRTLSLIPLTDCYGVSTEGLEYTLKNAEMRVGTTLGVSNVTLAGLVRVTLTSGTMLIIIAKD